MNLKSRNTSPPFPCGRQKGEEIKHGCGQKRIKNMVVDMILSVSFVFVQGKTYNSTVKGNFPLGCVTL